MRLIKQLSIAIALLASLHSCKNGDNNYDASGSFEAEETIISSEASGVIKEFGIEEGQQLKAGQMIGYIDSTQLFLKKKQLLSQIKAVISKKPNVSVQLASLQEQLRSAEKEQLRVTNLAKADAATGKQLDDINSQVLILQKQIAASSSSLNISSESIDMETNPLAIQIDQLNDQLDKCRITNPMNGTVLSKYAELNEMTAPGKPLYKIADLSTIILRVYVTGDQLASIKLNQQAKVHTDDGHGNFNESSGTISWISDKAEFTPKTIQTKDERANMVYAIKINVKNNGQYKIGMYGEVIFN